MTGAPAVPVRIGLAGLGAMGRNHLRILSARPDAQLVAVADPVAEALEAAAAQSGAQAFADESAAVVRVLVPFEPDSNLVCLALNPVGNRSIACANLGQFISPEALR